MSPTSSLDTSNTRTVPFAPGVFTWPDADPRLIGSRCRSCSAETFPAQDTCPRCGKQEMEEHLLPRRGTLYSWTTQGFLPKAPYAGGETAETFEPFGVGLVELGNGEIRVEGRLTESDPEKLRFGMEVELVIVPFRFDPADPADADGQDTEVLVYAFKPVEEGGAADA